MSFKRFLLCTLLLTSPAFLLAQEAPPAEGKTLETPEQIEQALAAVDDTDSLLQLAAQLREAGEIVKETLVWKRLAALRPHVGAMRFEMAAGYAQQDMKSEAYNALLELQAAGFAYEVENDPRFEKVSTTEVWQYVVQGFQRNRDSFGEGKVAYTLPREDLLIESLAFDATRGRLLAGGVREGKVYVVEEDGSLKALAAADETNGMWGVFGVAVDAQRGVLWVASSAVPHYKGYSAERDLGKAGIFKFELASGKFIKSFLSPVVPGQSFVLSNIAVAGDGSVYALDGVNNVIYQVRDDSFRRLLQAPHLSGLRGLTVSGDSKRLYFSDVERGVFGLDLDTGKPFDIAVPRNLALAGIESMAWWNDHLIVVQNGLPPNRIMRLKLSADGRQIALGHPLEANQQALPLQVGAAIGENAAVYLIGNSQRNGYDRFGLPRNRERIEGARIYRLQADFAMDRQEARPTQFVR
ncbi:hypothetical protein [uncultured Aquimonas sp.]|mgnify:CR=1 FL=1|jgi:hypothetical protein|uniref:hypothetical protein n=1 Tax=uncultured Aquimonas sp. TaxID=385483 RepID=UPI00086921C3|nr:hypothetical protein [uncultured Aquimonas sp.]ODU48197.1 MAG: hypothetical protein ABS96_02420 [Xanthomonadaceae bacterium SCN 69-123]